MEGGKIIHKELSYKIVGILFEVFNELGYGYQEKIYEKAIAECFIKDSMEYKRQVSYKVIFKNKEVGRYYLDFLVEDKIILELKRGEHFSKNNINQVKGYLKATNLKLAILANYTSKGVKILRVLNPNNQTIQSDN